MKFAVIKTGGKQYKVQEGDKVRLEKLIHEGDAVSFDEVLLVIDGEKVEVGMPTLKGVSVEGKVIRDARDDKKIVFRYHSKTRYRKFKTHRQAFTEVTIGKIK